MEISWKKTFSIIKLTITFTRDENKTVGWDKECKKEIIKIVFCSFRVNLSKEMSFLNYA